MATDDTISREAHERVTRERDEYKAQLAEARAALDDVAQLNRIHTYLKQKPDIKDAYQAASTAIRDVTLKGVASEELPQRLDSWLEEQRGLFAAAPAPSPFQGPNPGAAGFQAKVEPMVVGGERWKEWAKGKTSDEKLAAMQRGDAVSSEKVKRAQGTAQRGAP